MFNRRLLIANSGGTSTPIVTINFYLKCPNYQPGIIDLPVTFKISDKKNRRINLLCKSKFYRWRSCEFVCGNGI